MGQLRPHPSTNFTSTVGPGITSELLNELERIYPAPIANASAATNTYATDDTRGWALANDYTFNSAGFAVAQAAKKAGVGSWYYRFNAPQTERYPAYYGASHSADNCVRRTLAATSSAPR